jgi:hypothetical protein
MGRGEAKKIDMIDLDDVFRSAEPAYVLTPRDALYLERSEAVRSIIASLESDSTLDILEDPSHAIHGLANDVNQPVTEIDELVDALITRMFSEEGQEDLNDFLVLRTGAFGGLEHMDDVVEAYRDCLYRSFVRQLSEGETNLLLIFERVRRKAHSDILGLGVGAFAKADDQGKLDRLFANIPKTTCGSTEEEIRVVLHQMRDSLQACYGDLPNFDLPGDSGLMRTIEPSSRNKEFDRATLIAILVKNYWPQCADDLEGAHLPASPFHNRLRKMLGLYEMEYPQSA